MSEVISVSVCNFRCSNMSMRLKVDCIVPSKKEKGKGINIEEKDCDSLDSG